MILIRWLLKLFSGRKKEKSRLPTVPDTSVDYSWEYAERNCFYVAAFRERLEGVASAIGTNVKCRFNPEQKCAELLDDWGVIARITVRGECGAPYAATVLSQRSLPNDLRMLLAVALPDMIRFESTACT